MRICSIDIRNLRGVRTARLDGLDDAALLTLAGRNGVGKSLVLLGILLAWRGQLERSYAATLVGPWSTDGRASIALTFDEAEWASIVEFGQRLELEVPPTPQAVRLEIGFSDLQEVQLDDFEFDAVDSAARTVLRNPVFRQEHPFARVDFVPAERQISRQEQATPDPQSLNTKQSEEWGRNVQDSLLNAYGPVSLFGILPYLASLDYAAFLEERAGRESLLGEDYAQLAAGFALATGKRIEHPSLAIDGQIAIFVDAGAGNRHSLSQLSSGEQEALGLMYLVRSLSARGGVLLIDEPEQHLHPTLQRTLVSVLHEVGSHSQLWLSTHSAALITGAPLQSLVSVQAADDAASNQLSRVALLQERLSVLTEIGMPPSAWQQGDFLLVVEGATDERYLTRLLPQHLGRALILVAGNAEAVRKVSAALRGNSDALPWLAVRDRDLTGDAELADAALAEPEVHIWSRRAIESMFLDERWLEATVARAGGSTPAADFHQQMLSEAAAQRPEIERLLVERRLLLEFAAPVTARTDLEAWFVSQAEVAAERGRNHSRVAAEVHASVQAAWDVRWAEWAQAKRILAVLLKLTPFRSLENLLDAMIVLATDDETFLPADVTSLRSRIEALHTKVELPNPYVHPVPGVLPPLREQEGYC